MQENEFEKLNEKLERICNQLELLIEDKYQITEMAEKQGFDKIFTYYTLDNEFETHYPHVHICVSNNEKSWDGKPLRSGNPLKTVGSVRLNRINGYTTENLEFEEIKDNKITDTRYKKEICNWLNSTFNGKRNNKETNAYRCINSYIMNNEGYYNKEVEKLLN